MERAEITRVGRVEWAPDGRWIIDGWGFNLHGQPAIITDISVCGWSIDQLEEIGELEALLQA